MIELSGRQPERDIRIDIIGIRPGERLHEELFNPYERLQPTPAQKILRAARDPLDPQWVERIFGEINLLVLEGDAAALAQHVAKLSNSRASAVGTPAPRPRSRTPPPVRRRLAPHMDSLPLGLSVHHFVSSVGADAGFAALIAVAILVLLYFAQARETATLRARADEAALRAQELEGLVADLGDQVAALPAEISVRATGPRVAAAYGGVQGRVAGVPGVPASGRRGRDAGRRPPRPVWRRRRSRRRPG